MRRTGEAGGLATRDNVAGMFDRIGNQFQQIGGRNTLVGDPQMGQELMDTMRWYTRRNGPNTQSPLVANSIDDIVSLAQQNGGAIPGDVYNRLRSAIGSDARGAARDPDVQRALYRIQESVDDAMERSMGAAGNHADVQALRDARNQYRNALVIERAATAGGEQAGQGLLTPGRLSQSVTGVQGRRNRATGEGDFAELADAADALLRPLPNSGTPVRAAAAMIPSAMGAALGGVAGTAAAPGLGTAIGGIGGAALGHALMAGAVNNPVSRAYLTGRIPGQQFFANPSSTAPRDALIQALMRARLLAPPQPAN
jgi:hypothetical protein